MPLISGRNPQERKRLGASSCKSGLATMAFNSRCLILLPVFDKAWRAPAPPQRLRSREGRSPIAAGLGTREIVG
jgi:hypothetical protein